MKKLISILLVVGMLFSLAACGGGDTAQQSTDGGEQTQDSNADTSAKEGGSTDGKTITFTMQKYGTDPAAQEKILDELVAEFKEQTGITVQYSLIDWGQALTKLTLACTGGEAPDVADVFFTNSMMKMGNGEYGPMEITDVYEEMGGDDAYFSTAIEEVKFDGKVYGIPWRMDTRVLVYNTEHFKEAGITEPPKTYDELIEVGKKLTQYDDNGNITRSGFVWNVGNSRFDQTWFTLMAGHGGRLMNEDYTEMSINTPAGEESLAFLRDIITEHKICTPNVIDPSFDANTEFMAEKTSMVYGVNADFKTTVVAQAPQLDGKFDAAVLPNKTGDGVSSIAFAAPICIMNNTKEYDAAKEWVKFFCSKDSQVRFCSAVNLINSRKDVMEDPIYSNDSWLKNFPAQAELAIQGDGQNPAWSQIDAFPNGPLNSLCTNVVAGEDIKATLETTQKDCEKILSETK